jgi:arylsulfatase A-like enzyme
LAAESVVCDNHLADGADEAAARRGWRSGRYDVPTAEVDATDLLAVLRAAGVRAQLVVDGTRSVDDVFTEGWDEADGVLPDKDETPLEATIAVAEETLETLADQDRWLLWVELGSALPPWQVADEFLAPFFVEERTERDEEEEEEIAEVEGPEEAGEALAPLLDPPSGAIDDNDDLLYLRLHNTYAAAVSYVDAAIGKLWDAVVELGLADDLLFVVTSDAGLPLGEHGIVGEGQVDAHQEIVHVPLIARLPGGVHGGRRVAGLTQGIDLLPTVASIFGVAVPAVDGRDLLPLLRGEVEQVRSHAYCVRRVGAEISWTLRTLKWAYLLRGGAAAVGRLYIKPDDRYEVDDVAGQYLELAEEMDRRLREFGISERES